ncbi:MAG: hypothetical protein C5B55_12285, partial [Blastocatellia bacterium]
MTDRNNGSKELAALKQARAEFESAAHELVDANRKGRAMGQRYTAEMGVAAEQLSVMQQRLK